MYHLSTHFNRGAPLGVQCVGDLVRGDGWDGSRCVGDSLTGDDWMGVVKAGRVKAGCVKAGAVKAGWQV